MNVKSGLLAGLSATLVLSIIMIIKSAMGLMPQVNAIQALTGIGANYFGLPQAMVVGWILHLLIGIVLWGLVFAGTVNIWPTQSYLTKGLVFSVAAWFLMMIIVMPMAGAGAFGIGIGMAAPVATLILHLVYGAVLGGVYGKLEADSGRASEAGKST